MVENFIRLKKKYRADAALKASLAGISAGSLASAAFVFIQKLRMIAPSLAVAIIIGLAAAISVGAVTFAVLLPRERRLAKLLDSRLSVGEKVQTMVEFADKDSEMISLQREDANKKLCDVSRLAPKKRTLIKYIALFLLSAAVLAAAIITPKKEPAPIPDPDFEMDSWQETSLKNLIQYVKDSGMEETPKQAVVELLEDLLLELENAGKVSEMKESVVGAIVKIDEIRDAANSYVSIRTELDASSNEAVKLLGSTVSSLGSSALPDAFDELKEKFVYAEFANATKDFSDKAGAALLKSGYNENDMLFAAIDSFIGKMEILADGIANYDEEGFNTKFSEYIATAASEINAALRQQKTNSSVAEYTILKLVEIFEIPTDDIPDLGSNELPGRDNNGDGDYNDDDDDRPSTDGGLGSGDAIYGSDDVIYDPDENRYVVYGEILNEYYAKISEMLISGTLTEEQIEFINEYFAILYDGSKKQD